MFANEHSIGGTATLVHVKWRAFVKVIATAERCVIIALGSLLLINIFLPSNGACILNEVECLFDELSVYLDTYADYPPSPYGVAVSMLIYKFRHVCL